MLLEIGPDASVGHVEVHADNIEPSTVISVE
jgi:hypothetical protein